GPDAADEAQSVAVVEPDQQRAEVRPSAARRGEASDHRIDFAQDLDLEPLARAAGPIRTVGALGDDPLGAVLAGELEQLLALLGEVRRVSKPRARVQDLLEQALALDERRVAQVVAVEPWQVEGVEDDRR